ncbi:MAG: DUF123 domain-containing protein [Methanobrevibacter sp.]|jgi:Uri superfamily endonuclease|nr:DUF123 domain-containing protein [Methanobrevibacter sp.]
MKKSSKIRIGSIYDSYEFQEGTYIYIGSAMNSLIPRLNRHLSDEKKIHWHVDYLLANKNVAIEEIIFNIGEKRIECDLAKSIAKNGDEIPKFGCSDCNCNSHLIYFKKSKDGIKYTKKAYDNLSIDYHDLTYFNKLKTNKLKIN